MPDPTNPTIIASASLRPNGISKVCAIYEIRLQPALLPDLNSLPNKVICKLSNMTLGPFRLDGPPIVVDTQQQDGDLNIYHMHVRFVPVNALAKGSKITDLGLLGAEDYTFSIEYNIGSAFPPPPNPVAVNQRLPVIEVDPCDLLNS